MSGARFRSSACIAVGLLLRASVAVGQTGDESLDDLDLVKLLNVEVSTPTKTAESQEEAPAVITVVTQADIRRWGYQTVADVLAHVQGFYLIDDHILPDIGVRGMTGGLGSESGVIKVMIDGRSVAYRTTSGNWLGAELIPMESIAQIEIIRGPASALYGADAFLGVVNIITWRPDELGRVRGRATFGLTGTNPGERVDVAGGRKVGKWSVALGAVGELTDRSGLELPPESPAPILPSYVDGRRTALNLERRSLGLEAQLGWSDERRGHLLTSAYYSAFERGGDFAHWAQLTNGVDGAGHARGTIVSLDQLRLNLDGLAHASRTVDLSLAATYSQGGVLPPDRIDVASDLFYVKRHQSYRGVDATAEARWMPAPRFNLIAGTEAVFDHEDFGAPEEIDFTTGQPLPREGATNTEVDLVNLGAYASANWKALDPWLKLTGGLRYDHHNVYGSQVTGRAVLTSRLGHGLGAKLLYGNAFKAPSPYLLYAAPLRPGDVIGNRNLEPMRIHTLEYEMSWRPSATFGITSSVSYNWLLDKAEFTLEGINQTARNVASQRSLSWETRADVRYGEQLTAYASFDLVQSRRDLGQEGYAASLIGTKNVVYPPWIARAGVDVALPSPVDVPLAVGGETIVVAPRRAADTSIVESGGSFTLPTYCLLDAFVTTRDLYLIRGQETRLALRGRNLLGSRGPDPGPSGFEYPLTAREVFLELRHMY
ncbi:MAG TPA: TonB-dependent receptor [Polyangia bacterium]|jgi:iron complex outermembrane receptor protein|nr:TonB-dependent receptor [Polyangia bacterium]